MLLGSPLQGSLAVRRILGIPGGRFLLSKTLAEVSNGFELPIPDGMEVACIAGRFNFLLGSLLCPGMANDTLVCVDETRHPGLSDHRVLPLSHAGMLLSRRVSNYIVHFLRNGPI
jgi:hypothetical protein